MDTPSSGRHEDVTLRFYEMFWADRDQGIERSLADYIARFPDDQEIVAAEFPTRPAEADEAQSA